MVCFFTNGNIKNGGDGEKERKRMRKREKKRKGEKRPHTLQPNNKAMFKIEPEWKVKIS